MIFSPVIPSSTSSFERNTVANKRNLSPTAVAIENSRRSAIPRAQIKPSIESSIATSTARFAKSGIPPAVPSPLKRDTYRPTQFAPASKPAVTPTKSKHIAPATTSIMPLPVITTVPQHIQDQWLFSDEELNAAPSILHGMPIAEERARRAKGVNFITQAGIMLRLPQVTLGTASMFLHRFFMRMSMDDSKGGIHHYNIAATALFLATKSEENCRKTKDIVIAVAKIAGKNPALVVDEQSKEFWRWKDSILLYEELMLEYLTFDVVLDSPYTHLYHLLKKLDLEQNKDLRNCAWAFVNDSQLTTLGLSIPAKDLAIGAVFFAARFTGNTIEDDEWGTPWWEHVGGNGERIIKAVTVLHDFYTNNPIKKSDSPQEGSPPKTREDLNGTRHRRNTGPENGGSVRKENGENSDTSPSYVPRSPYGDSGSHRKEKSDESTESRTTKGQATQPRQDEGADGTDSWGDSNAAPPSTHTKGASKESTQASANTDAEAEDGEVRGDSDEKLKEAANDPSTHNQKASRASSVAGGVGDLHIAQEASDLNDDEVKNELREGKKNGHGDGKSLEPPRVESGNMSVKRKADDVEMEEAEESESKRAKMDEGEIEEGEL